MYLPNHSAMDRMLHQFNFKWSKAGLNLVFLLLTGCLIKAEEQSLPYCLSIAWVRTDGFMFFPNETYPGFQLGSLIPFLQH